MLTDRQPFARSFLYYWPALLLVLAWPASSATVATNNPYQLMQQVTEKTFQHLQREQTTIARDPNYLRTVARQELMPFVHTRYIGALLLGHLFETLESPQQQRYFQTLEGYLEQNCAQLLAHYRNSQYQVESEKPFEQRNLVAIRLQLLQEGSEPLRIDFKWRRNSKTQQWQLYDILIEGISLITTKQQEWSNLLRHSGFEVLLKQLQEAEKQPISLS